MTRLRGSVLLLGLGTALAPGIASAQVLGSEFQVNSFAPFNQSTPSAATLANGGFVVVWTSAGSCCGDNSDYSIEGRRFASDGSPIGSDFLVNSYVTGRQSRPSVAALPSGGFVVTWRSGNYSPGNDNSGYSIQARRFDSSGSGIGADFQVNTYTTNSQTYPAVAALGTAGDFVVVWQSTGSYGTDSDQTSINGQRFASNGTAAGLEFQVNTYTTNQQNHPRVSAAGTAGDFVVVWESNGSSLADTSQWGILGQRYASDGSTQGTEFQVNSVTAYSQHYPAVATVGTAGDFVVAWKAPSGAQVKFQRFDSSGSTLGSELQANSSSPLSLTQIGLAPVGTAGNFVVTWSQICSSCGDTSGFGIEGRRFASDGTAIGSDFQVNTWTTSSQSYATVAAAGTVGDFVVAWQNHYDIIGKILRPNSVTVAAPTLSTDRWGVGTSQRIRWEHRSGATGRFNVDLSRDGGASFATNLATNMLPGAATAGNLYYTVTDDAGTYVETAKVRIGVYDDPTSTGTSLPFSIDAGPVLTVKQPWNTFVAQLSPFTIVWTHNLGYRSRMKVELSTDGGSTFSTLLTSLTYNQWINRGTYDWNTPPQATCPFGSAGCKIKVTWLDGGGTTSAQSNLFFLNIP